MWGLLALFSAWLCRLVPYWQWETEAMLVSHHLWHFKVYFSLKGCKQLKFVTRGRKCGNDTQEKKNPRIQGMLSDRWRFHSKDAVNWSCLPCVTQSVTLGPLKRRIVPDKQHLLCVRDRMCVCGGQCQKNTCCLYGQHILWPLRDTSSIYRQNTERLRLNAQQQEETEESARWSSLAWEHVATMLLTGSDDITEDLAWSSDSQIVGRETLIQLLYSLKMSD